MRSTSFDLSPFHRSVIGFERLARALENGTNPENGYPPYNIERLGDDQYRVSMAVAGFRPEEVDVTVHDGVLTVTGKQAESEEEGREYLHRGIATRAFERRFQLADHIEVVGASLENGLLSVDLERQVPEEKKPRKIEIGSGRTIENNRQTLPEKEAA